MFGKKYATCAKFECRAVVDPKVSVSAWRTEVDHAGELYARKIYFCAAHKPPTRGATVVTSNTPTCVSSGS